MKTLADALRASSNPLADFQKLSRPVNPIVGSTPAPTQCPPRNAPGARVKPRRGKFMMYRDDWNPNADGSGFAEVHDAVNGWRHRTDLEALDLNHVLAFESRDTIGTEDAGHDNRKQPSTSKILNWLRDSTTVSAEPEPVEVMPQPSKRKLMQKTSRKQRVMLHAVRLSQRGMDWDTIAKALGISRAEARRLRQRVVNLIGNEAIRQDVGYARKKRMADVL